MPEKNVRIGFDRFLALEWVNYSLDLYLSGKTTAENYDLLKSFVQRKVEGLESARKTSNQLKRIWLNETDQWEELRNQSRGILFSTPVIDKVIFHYGMAYSVFPIFKQTCKILGELLRVQNKISRNTVIDRVSTTFVNPSSIPRIVPRVIQTLEDWKIIVIEDGFITELEKEVKEKECVKWFTKVIIQSGKQHGVSLRYLSELPEKLGFRLSNLRENIEGSPEFNIHRNILGDVVVGINNDRII